MASRSRPPDVCLRLSIRESAASEVSTSSGRCPPVSISTCAYTDPSSRSSARYPSTQAAPLRASRSQRRAAVTGSMSRASPMSVHGARVLT